MKALFRVCLFLTAFLAIQTAPAAITLFVSKEPAAKTGMSYTFSFTCSNGAKGTFNVVAENDSSAKKIADEKARIVCEETTTRS